MKNKKAFILFPILAALVAISSCSKAPLDTPVKSSTINEYFESVTKISKAMKNKDRKRFLSALKVVAYDYEYAVMYRLTGAPKETQEALMEIGKLVDGKTPRQIIEMAENKNEIKRRELPSFNLPESETAPSRKKVTRRAPNAQQSHAQSRAKKLQAEAWAEGLRNTAEGLKPGESVLVETLDGGSAELTRDNVEDIIESHRP